MLPSISSCQSESQPCHTDTLPNDWGRNHPAILSQSTQFILSQGRQSWKSSETKLILILILRVKVILSLWSL